MTPTHQSNKVRRDGLAVTWNSASCSYFTVLSLALRQVQNKGTFCMQLGSVLQRCFMSLPKMNFYKQQTCKLVFLVLDFRMSSEKKNDEFAFTAAVNVTHWSFWYLKRDPEFMYVILEPLSIICRRNDQYAQMPWFSAPSWYQLSSVPLRVMWHLWCPHRPLMCLWCLQVEVSV